MHDTTLNAALAAKRRRDRLVTAAFDWLTDDRDPSTRDLLALEGLRHAEWIDTEEETRRIVREIVSGYGRFRDTRQFLALYDLTEED